MMPPKVTALMVEIGACKHGYERLNDELQKALEGFRDCAHECLGIAGRQEAPSDAPIWATWEYCSQCVGLPYREVDKRSRVRA